MARLRWASDGHPACCPHPVSLCHRIQRRTTTSSTRSRNAARKPARKISRSAGKDTGKAAFELGSGNVYLDVGFPPAEDESLLMRTQLTHALGTLIKERKLTQTQAGRLLGVSQPRVSDVTRGRIERFTIDALVEMLARAGVPLEIVTKAI